MHSEPTSLFLSPSGDDARDCRSLEKACQTLDRVFAAVLSQTGDVVVEVLNGTYKISSVLEVITPKNGM